MNLMEVAGGLYMYLVIHVSAKNSRRQNDNKLLHKTEKKGIHMNGTDHHSISFKMLFLFFKHMYIEGIIFFYTCCYGT